MYYGVYHIMALVLLENIRSSHNVGSIFRSADAVGVSRMLLCGHTPCPIDRMGRVNDRLLKTSLGSEQSVPWDYFSDSLAALRRYSTHIPIAVEQTEQSVPYRDFSFSGDHPLFIFGNEVDGVSSETLHRASHHIFLPMCGSKESLNVSVCAGIVLYHFLV